MMIRQRHLWAALVGMGLLAAQSLAADVPRPRDLFPVCSPFDQGFLEVSEIHTIAYSMHGNRNGKPVFVLHGGPGFGCYPRLTQYFDPEKFLIVLHDQRGAGQSRPAGEIRENTTQHLVEDIERLRKHLKIDQKILVFGGSWGSTLGLAYAETYPDQVAGMVIRGVFGGTRKEIGGVFAGEPMRLFFPDAVGDLEAALPPELPDFEPGPLLKFFLEARDARAQKVIDAWIRLAIKTGKLYVSDEEVEAGWGSFDARPGVRIDCHYAANAAFLEDGQLLRDAHKLEGIPMTIINGRYDIICPPSTAYRLHKLLPKSKLVIVEEAGHSEGEPGTMQALLKAVEEFE